MNSVIKTALITVSHRAQHRTFLILPVAIKNVFYALFGMLLLQSVVCAAQTPNAIEFQGLEDELLTNVQARVGLVARLQEGTPLQESEWLRLSRAVPKEIKAALRPYGYYQPIIIPVVTEKLISYQIETGPPLIIKSISIEINGTAESLPEFKKWRRSLPFKVGDRLRQMEYESSKKKLLALTLRYGFFDAELVKHELRISQDLVNVDVILQLDSGPRYQFGEVSLDWQGQPMRIREGILKPYIKVKPGADYDADKLTSSQSALQSTPYFTSVDVSANVENSVDQQVPITIVFNERKRHAYNFAIGAGTDTGIRASIGYENRRLNSLGHHFNGRIGTSDIRRTAILNYRVPLTSGVQDSLNFFASLEEEDNDSRRFSVSKIGTELTREWRESLLSVGVTASRENYFFGEVEQTVDLVLPNIGWQKIVTDNPYSPQRGWSASATLRGASESIGSDIDLLQVIVDAKALMPLGDGRLLMRLKAAGSDVADTTALPASLGFLTGGDRSVRGYRYESIGVPADQLSSVAQSFDLDSDSITVGRHLLVGSVEYEHPLKNGFAIASFFDAGDAFNNELDLKRGVGAGLRWRLPFGALKLDLASALDREGNPLRLHLSFGTDL